MTDRKIPLLDTSEMSFLDHLESLRWHIIRGVAAILVFTIVAFVNKYFLFHELILGPSRSDFWTYRQLCMLAERLNEPDLCIKGLNFTLQSRTMGGQFTTHLTVSFVAGLIVAFPYVFWEIWRFIRPGLYPQERRATQGAVAWVSLLFFTGIMFGYYVLSPLSINFLANYTVDESVTNNFDISSYMSTLVIMVMACGLTFQLPMIVLVLSKIGILTPKFMRTYRRHAIIVILIVSAVLTPSPDVFSQLLVAIPIYFLYELSIFVSRSVEKGKLAKANA
jgi:sec-independent protein translocase protein TatC